MVQVKDVVCGMTVDSETAEHKSEYQGETYYFCSAGCKRAFDQKPDKYIGGKPTGQAGRGQR